MMNKPPRRSTGFTLVEVLVAMSIMAIVALMSWQGVDGIVRARTASQDKLEQLLRVNTVLGQWEQDLNALQDTGTAVPALAFDGAKITLTRRTPSGLQLVVWSLRGGTWLRWAGPPATTTRAIQDNWLASQQFLGNEPGQLRTLAGISQWQVYFYRGNAWTNAQSSAGSEPSALVTPPRQSAGGAQSPQPPALNAPKTRPQGVRLVLTFTGEKGNVGTVTRDIALGQ
jgi:general secretion pathway protein J